MGMLDWLLGGSQIEEPNGKTDWLGNPVDSPSSRGGQGEAEWWDGIF